MWSRLASRGLPVALSIVALLLISPTPVPRHALDAWTTVSRAARSGAIASAEQSLADLQLSSAWFPALRANAIRLALANRNGERALALLEARPALLVPQVTVDCWRAEALAQLGHWEQSTRILTSLAPATCPTPVRLLRDLAIQELESSDLTTATSILRQLVPLDPQDADAASLLGACLVIGDAGEALSVLQVPAERGNPLALDLLAALSNLPSTGSSPVLTASGQVFMQHGLWPLAAQAFRQLVALEPGNAAAHAYYGMALDQQGLDGLAEIETAARLDPGSTVALSLLGLHWQMKGQPLQAIAFLERAAELDPGNSAFVASLASARAEAGDVQAALIGYQQAAELQPGDPMFWRLLAAYSIAREIELDSTGLPAARNAAVLNPEAPESLDWLGYAHSLLGDLATAERLLVRAVLLDPTSASARLHYGLLLSSLGRTGEARTQLTAAASLGGASPTGQFAQRALTQMGD